LVALLFVFLVVNIGDATILMCLCKKCQWVSTRPPISLSDIGFGLERIRWILSGGSYFDIQAKDDENCLSKEARVYCSTLSLLASEGQKPTNKGAGYRFRLLSKKLVENLSVNHESTEKYLRACYNYWSDWTEPTCDKQDAIEMINKENSRNFNRLIVNNLAPYLVKNGQGMDVNVPTNIFLKRLKNTPAYNHLESTLNKLGAKDEKVQS